MPISLSIGEPKHATPQFIRDALSANLDGLANYPTTAGSDALRNAIAKWLATRYGIPALNGKTEVLPVNGSREALFAFAQAVIDRTRNDPVVVCPNPFYQIYEGAAILAGATPRFLNNLPARQLRDELRATARRCLATLPIDLRVLAGQSDRAGDAAGGMESAVRDVRPLRIRDRFG